MTHQHREKSLKKFHVFEVLVVVGTLQYISSRNLYRLSTQIKCNARMRCCSAAMQCCNVVMQCRNAVLRCRNAVLRCRNAVLRCRNAVAVPQCSVAVPQCSDAVPRCSAAVPQCIAAVPQCSVYAYILFSSKEELSWKQHPLRSQMASYSENELI